MQTIESLIEYYKMVPHPEGGYYKETYCSKDKIPVSALPIGFSEDRVLSTAILFLLPKDHFSGFHRIKSDECWHFYQGQTLLVYVLHLNGALEIIKLGNNAANGEVYQAIVPANCWFASEPATDSDYCFVGCTVSPGFNFNDFELASATALSKEFPEHSILINRLCRLI